VSKRRYAVISDAVNRPAPRIVSAIEELARQLHPEAFVEKPADAKEKIEKENPPAQPRSFLHFAPLPDSMPVEVPAPIGGCACAR
jgi:hypothetical protein